MRDDLAALTPDALSSLSSIGLLKRDQLPLEQSPELLALQRRAKAAFDPKGIMNPGKVFSP